MKIGRTQDHVAIVITDDEYAKFIRKATSLDGRLRCTATLDPTEQRLRVQLGKGRAFTKSSGAANWRVALDPHLTRAQRLPEFGLTPVMYAEPGMGRIDIFVPDVRSETRRTRVKTPGPFVSLRPVTRPAPPEDPPMPFVSDEELKVCKEIFNRAIHSGYEAVTDARGRILWFDRKAAED